MIRIQTEPFDSGAEITAMADPGAGAVVTFTGFVRDFAAGSAVSGIVLEHYPGMTDKALTTLEHEARARWSLNAVTIIHRVGSLDAGDPIVLVAVSSAHRRDAFEACQYVMDMLKTRVPLWKKERFADGDAWVASRESDQAMAKRWE